MDLRRQHADPFVGGGDAFDSLVDDSEAIALQKPLKEPLPPGMSRETHELVMATMEGAKAWRKEQDAEAQRLRVKRLAELRAAEAPPAIREVGPEAMLEVIRASDGRAVVVHVSNDGPACRRVDAAMRDLDRRITDTPTDSRVVGKTRPVFLKLAADDAAGAMHEVDKDALPALLVYFAGDLVSSTMQVNIRDADDLEDHLDDLGLF